MWTILAAAKQQLPVPVIATAATRGQRKTCKEADAFLEGSEPNYFEGMLGSCFVCLFERLALQMLCICSVCHQVSHTAPKKVSVRMDCRVVYALLRIGALAMTSVLRCTSQELLGVGIGCMATCNHDCLNNTILDHKLGQPFI